MSNNGIPNIIDKWTPWSGILINAFASVDGNFNKLIICVTFDAKRVENKEIVKSIKYRLVVYNELLTITRYLLAYKI